jgi:pSer/pThr/pTyr-binding forkhead associated (FHA) protein
LKVLSGRDQMPFCTACGHQNPDDARFCSQCGTRIVTAEPPAAAAEPQDPTATMTFRAPAKSELGEERPLNDADAAAVDALPSGSALLVVQRGPSAGSRFLLDDVTVSRRHAEFKRGPNGFTVRDVGSLNGTYVNRDRIDEVVLQGGDEVQIGKFRLVFFASHADAAR